MVNTLTLRRVIDDAAEAIGGWIEDLQQYRVPEHEGFETRIKMRLKSGEMLDVRVTTMRSFSMQQYMNDFAWLIRQVFDREDHRGQLIEDCGLIVAEEVSKMTNKLRELVRIADPKKREIMIFKELEDFGKTLGNVYRQHVYEYETRGNKVVVSRDIGT